MNKAFITEERLVKLIRRVIREQDELQATPTDSNPLAKETFKKVIDHLSATKGAYSLQNKTTSTTTEDDKLKKTWKWKTNDGKVDVTVSVDVKMAKQKKA
jgi:predicted metal-dependent hydrolase|tara:strand:- start:2184 stop:2483 length:300 start_codon:yes stop_codon:yes gene_type:complete